MAFIYLRIPPLLFMPPQLLVLLRWPYRPLSRLRSSLRLRVGLRLPLPTRLCLLRTCAYPAWLCSPPRFHPLPDGPPAPLALLLIRIHLLALGFLLRLRSLVCCGSLRGPPPVALRSLNVRRSDLPPFLIVFPPGSCLSTPGCMFGLRLYIAVHRLYRLFCPVRGDAVRSPMPRCHGVRVYVLHGEGCGLLLGFTTIALYVSFG